MSEPQTVAKYFGLALPPTLKKKALLVPDNAYTIKDDTLVGIEVEVENVLEARGHVSSYWTGKEDGSLRNRGYEFVTPAIPASVTGRALRELFSVILNNDAYSFTPRTSVHVHLNAQDMTTTEIKLFLLVYCLYERILYSYVGKGRYRNIFCVPVMHTSYPDVFLADGGITHLRWQKYLGLNLCTLQTFGTIEFRHMHGTSDIEKLNTWVGMITKIRKFVKETTHKEFLSLICGDEDLDFHSLTERIFEEYAEIFKTLFVQEMAEQVVNVKRLLIKEDATRSLKNELSSEALYFKSIKL